MTANVWDAVIPGYTECGWDELPMNKIEPRMFMALFIFLFTAFKPGWGGGELRETKWSHFEFKSDRSSIYNPSKYDSSDSNHNGGKKVFPSSHGKDLHMAVKIYEKLRPIFPDIYKFKETAFLTPLSAVRYKGSRH